MLTSVPCTWLQCNKILAIVVFLFKLMQYSVWLFQSNTSGTYMKTVLLLTKQGLEKHET